MQITTISVTKEVNLDKCTNSPPPPHPLSMVIMSLVNYTGRTWSSSPSPLTPGHGLDLYYKHSLPPPTIPAKNLGAPHITTLNTTTPMPASFANEPPNLNAYLDFSHQLTYDGANPNHPQTKHSMVTPTLHPHQVYIHFNYLVSAFQKHIAYYYAIILVRSNFIPQPLCLTYSFVTS